MTQPGGSGGGDATAANQIIGNASLASIDSKTPALGQQLAAASQPVVLTAAQLSTLTPPAAITGFATAAKQDTGNISLASIDSKLTNPLPVSGLISTKTDLTPSAPTAVSVGVASAQAVAANTNRKGLLLVNTSTARISLGFGASAVLDSGVTLYPQGTFCMDEYSFDLGVVNAIASAATSNLAIQEYS